MIQAERLFIYNIFECCGYREYNESDFFCGLDDKTMEDIKNEIKLARNAVRRLQLDADACPALPRKFIKFVEENKKPRTKSKDYFLCQLYDQILNVNRVLESKKLKNGSEDKVIDDFLGIVESNECLRVFSRPKDILQMSSRPYAKTQIKVITFVLREIIPQYEIDSEMFCNKLTRQYTTWNQLILCKGRDQVATVDIQSEEEEIAAKFKKYYDELKDANGIGNTLVDMFDSLVRYSQSNCFVEAKKQKPLRQNSDDNRACGETNEIIVTDYDATISTRILDFMRWLPMVENNWNPQLIHMKAIEHVIEKIRKDYIELAKLAQEDSKRGSFIDESSIFMAANAVSLRKKLILALNDETAIRKLLRNYYCQVGGAKDE